MYSKLIPETFNPTKVLVQNNTLKWQNLLIVTESKGLIREASLDIKAARCGHFIKYTIYKPGLGTAL